jgi:hypothetical protein
LRLVSTVWGNWVDIYPKHVVADVINNDCVRCFVAGTLWIECRRRWITAGTCLTSTATADSTRGVVRLPAGLLLRIVPIGHA